MPITPIGSQRLLFQTVRSAQAEEAPALPQWGAGAGGKESGFASRLTQALEQVNELQVAANEQSAAVASGQTEALHDAVLAMNKADLALQLTIQITNRAVDAYKQVSQMQV